MTTDHRDVVPGAMHCARCKFRLNRVTIYMQNGALGAGSNETEPCPNGCGPLWPVTWENEARECWARIEELAERLSAPAPLAATVLAAAPSYQSASDSGARLPSRYQLGDPVRAYGIRGTVEAVTFGLVDGMAKVMYDVSTKQGLQPRVLSEHLSEADPGHLRAVPDAGPKVPHG